MAHTKNLRKAHQFIDKNYLEHRKRTLIKAGYPVSKWIVFCEWALDQGLRVFLHESKSTVSKYLYVSQKSGGPEFKIRYSNHKPNVYKESMADCDFFVGVAHHKTTTTLDAIHAVLAWCWKQDGVKSKATVEGVR